MSMSEVSNIDPQATMSQWDFKASGFKPFVEQLERLRASARDVVIDTSRVKASVFNKMAGKWTPESNVPSYVEDWGIKVGDMGILQTTDWATTQLAQKLGIPKGYMDKMARSGKAGLVCQNVNAWMPDRPKRMFRTLEAGSGQRYIRAVLSDRYRVLDNYDLAFGCMDALLKHDADFKTASISESRMYIHAIFKGSEQSVDLGNGDIHYNGVYIVNSEVGNGSAQILPAIWRQVCSNGMMGWGRGEAIFNRRHLGSQIDSGIYKPETLTLESAYILSSIQDIIETLADPEPFKARMTQIASTKEVKPESIVDTVEGLAITFNLSEGLKKRVMDTLAKDYTMPTDAIGSQYALSNAITMSAQSLNPDAQYEMQRMGSEVAMMTPKKFLRLEEVYADARASQ